MAKRKPGRPPKDVDAALIAKYAEDGCPVHEIAVLVGCSVDTLERRFAVAIQKAIAVRRHKIREKQYTLALAGDRTMLVWLGKNDLGQTDKSDVTVRDVTKLTDAELEAEAKKLGLS